MSPNFDFQALARPNIWALRPYSSARDEYKGKDAIFLDANENPFNSPFNRYPDPRQNRLKQAVAELKGLRPEQVFLGNGSDEAIDLLFRVFCRPGQDNVLSIHPSYGMYQVCADVNDIELRPVLLRPDFTLDAEALLRASDANSKIIFLCSPNNPTANALDWPSIRALLEGFPGLVVVDEAYIDFCPEKSVLAHLERYPNLVVLQTFSKAWGMASLRLGMALAHPTLIGLMSKVKYPYNLNALTQEKALELLKTPERKDGWVRELLAQRAFVADHLRNLAEVEEVYPSDANFLLVKVRQAREVYKLLVERKVVVRDRSQLALCEGCLRVTIGSPAENAQLLEELRALVP